MRIGTAMMFEQASQRVAEQRARVVDAQEQVATGRKLNHVADDPHAARRVLRAESLLADIGARRFALDQGDHLLSATEGTLNDAENLVQRVQEMSIQFASDTYNAQDRLRAAEELVQIRERLLELANTQENGRYLFGGLASSVPPFDATAGFVGDTGQVEIPVGRGARVEATLPGGSPFTDETGGPSLFGTLDSLETALRADNGVAVGALVDDVSGHGDRLRQARQTIGHRFERVENVRAALDRIELTATRTLERDQQADLTESVLQLRQAETGLQGALLVTARLNELNLMNFI